jgi:Rap1a immunity proteins
MVIRSVLKGCLITWSGVLVAFIVLTPARAEDAVPMFMTGNLLYATCTSGNTSICEGYIIGVADTLAGYYAKGQVCFSPPGVTADQVRDVVVRYIASNPAQRHFGAAGMIVRALASAFPCAR